MLTSQRELFSTDPKIEKLARKAADKIRGKQGADQGTGIPSLPTDQGDPLYQNVDVFSMQASQLRSLGAEYVGHCIWNELKINDLLISEGVSKNVIPLMQVFMS